MKCNQARWNNVYLVWTDPPAWGKTSLVSSCVYIVYFFVMLCTASCCQGGLLYCLFFVVLLCYVLATDGWHLCRFQANPTFAHFFSLITSRRYSSTKTRLFYGTENKIQTYFGHDHRNWIRSREILRFLTAVTLKATFVRDVTSCILDTWAPTFRANIYVPSSG